MPQSSDEANDTANDNIQEEVMCSRDYVISTKVLGERHYRLIHADITTHMYRPFLCGKRRTPTQDVIENDEKFASLQIQHSKYCSLEMYSLLRTRRNTVRLTCYAEKSLVRRQPNDVSIIYYKCVFLLLNRCSDTV